MSTKDLNRNLNGLRPLSYMGVNPSTPPQLVTERRAPTVHDYIRFPLGTLWLIPPTNDIYILTSKVNNQATWTKLTSGGGGGGGVTWYTITTNTPAAVNSGYIVNGAGTVVFTLPAACPAGSVFKFTGINNATGWQVQANAGQTIYFGAMSTSVGGTLTSTETRNSIEIVCVVADTGYNVLSVQGNITIV